MSVVALELTLRAASPHYEVVGRCTLPTQDAPIEHADRPARVAIDQERLLALALDPAAYGLALGQMLLADPQLAQLVAQARSAAQQARLPLRLRLMLPAALQVLRWETLRDPTHPETPLLTTGEQVLCSRYLSSTDWTVVVPRPFGARRALVLLASPPDLKDFGLEPLVLEEQRALVEASFGAMPTTVLGRGQARMDRLIEELRRGPDILLILAHGRVDEEGETWLYLEGGDGLTEPVRGSDLAARLAELRVRPQLIILGSCESAGDGQGAALLALGPRLAAIGVPAVLAMQVRITMETLRGFLPACLRELERDGRIDAAVAYARGVVRERPDFWAPVLFLRLQSGRLWFEPQPAREMSKAPPYLSQNSSSSTPTVVQSGPLSLRQRGELLTRVALSYRERLANALAHQVRLQLGLHTRPDAVDPSWRRMQLLVSDEVRPVPPGTSVLKLFDDLIGQLLILGAPGAGKTTLLVELALALTERAQQDVQARIPVLLNVAAWRSGVSLRDWLKDTLPDALGASKRFAAQLAASDELILMLDGLDEVAESHRAACVAAVNAYLVERDLASPLVVGCRSREYAEIGARLQIAGAVELEPLELAVVELALVEVPGAQGVLAALQTDELLRELASTPLMVNVMLLAHGGQEVPLVQAQSLEERRDALWRAYIWRMLVQRNRTRWSDGQMLGWLRWLACQLYVGNQTNFLIDDLQPTVLPPVQWWWYRGINGLAYGLAVGLVYLLAFLLVYGLFYGQAYDLVYWLVYELRAGLSRVLVYGLFYGLVYGLVYGLFYSLVYGLSSGLSCSLSKRLVFGLSVWLSVWLSACLNTWLRAGLSAGLIYRLFYGLSSRLGAWLRAWLSSRLSSRLNSRLVSGLGGRLVVGLVFGLGVGRFYGLSNALGFGMSFGLFAGLVGVWVSRTIERREQQHWSWMVWWRGLRDNLVFGLGIGLVFGLSVGVFYGLSIGVFYGLSIGLAFGVDFGLSQGWVVSDLSVRRSPMQGLRASVKNGLASGLILGLGVGLFYGLASGLKVASADRMAIALFHGLGYGLAGGMSIGLIDGLLNAFTQHHILRLVLSRANLFPFRAVTFLEDMSAHLLLERDGAFYRFRHLLLRDFIADLSDAELAALASSVKRRGA